MIATTDILQNLITPTAPFILKVIQINISKHSCSFVEVATPTTTLPTYPLPYILPIYYISGNGLLISAESSNTEAINEHLPEQIRAIAILRVTKGFNCKGNCDGRTYSYMTPTFAFAPHEEALSESYRLPSEIRDKVAQVLKLYEGTHNYHNFTSKRQVHLQKDLLLNNIFIYYN